MDPELCLLGNFTCIRDSLNNAQFKFMGVALCVAKKCIAVSWKSDARVSIDGWSLEMNNCIPLEKITYCLRKRYDTFLKIWQPYLDHIDPSPAPST